MTPAARVAAAIEILDTIFDDTPAEQALTRWARARRFAGSKDRAAIRDHVFDALRSLRSYAWLGGQNWPQMTGRAVMIGALRHKGTVLGDVFSGEGHAPAPLDEDEARAPDPVPDSVGRNMPDPVWTLLEASLGKQAVQAAQALTERAPISLRVNLRKATRDHAQTQLAAEGIVTMPNSLSPAALTVTEGARKVQNSAAFLSGVVELQDASSQAVVERLPLKPGMQVLDYCAGGGGKALALAMRTGVPVVAYDVNAARMRDIPIRASRADVDIRVCADASQLPRAVDLVLADAPCSGSGSWRRAPDAKWAFTPERLAELSQVQARVMRQAAAYVSPGGILAYATCSVFTEENDAQVSAFLETNSGWLLVQQDAWAISAEGDGFYCAQLMRE